MIEIIENKTKMAGIKVNIIMTILFKNFVLPININAISTIIIAVICKTISSKGVPL
jgi:hypothetical protein